MNRNLIPKNWKCLKSFNKFEKTSRKWTTKECPCGSMQSACTEPRVCIKVNVHWIHITRLCLSFAICYLTITLKANIIILDMYCIYLLEGIFFWSNVVVFFWLTRISIMTFIAWRYLVNALYIFVHIGRI